MWKKAKYWRSLGGVMATIIGLAEGLIDKDMSEMGENETITLWN